MSQVSQQVATNTTSTTATNTNKPNGRNPSMSSMETIKHPRDDDGSITSGSSDINSNVPVGIPRSNSRSSNSSQQQRKRRSLNLVFGNTLNNNGGSPAAPEIASPSDGSNKLPSMLLYNNNNNNNNSGITHHRNRSSISEKRLSNGLELSSNLSSTSSWPSRPSTPSMTEEDEYSNAEEDVHIKGRQTTSSSANASKRSSLNISSEQDRLLQEKLQQLARNENAKLIDTYIEELNIATAGVGNNNGSSHTASPSSNHQRSMSLQPSSFVNTSSPKQQQQKITNRTRGSSLLSSSPRPYKRQKGSNNNNNNSPTPTNHSSNNSIFVFSEDDLQKLDATPTSMDSIPGPTRPGNIGGTILSWKMTSDIVKTMTKSVLSPDLFVDLTKFLWSTFTNPENFTEMFFFRDEANNLHLLPPSEMIVGMKENLPKWSEAIRFGLSKVGYILKSIGYSVFSFLVIFVQVTLIGIMLLAYVIGDIIATPVKYAQSWYTGKPIEKTNNPLTKGTAATTSEPSADMGDSSAVNTPPSKATLRAMMKKQAKKNKRR